MGIQKMALMALTWKYANQQACNAYRAELHVSSACVSSEAFPQAVPPCDACKCCHPQTNVRKLCRFQGMVATRGLQTMTAQSMCSDTRQRKSGEKRSSASGGHM